MIKMRCPFAPPLPLFRFEHVSWTSSFYPTLPCPTYSFLLCTASYLWTVCLFTVPLCNTGWRTRIFSTHGYSKTRKFFTNEHKTPLQFLYSTTQQTHTDTHTHTHTHTRQHIILHTHTHTRLQYSASVRTWRIIYETRFYFAVYQPPVFYFSSGSNALLCICIGDHIRTNARKERKLRK